MSTAGAARVICLHRAADIKLAPVSRCCLPSAIHVLPRGMYHVLLIGPVMYCRVPCAAACHVPCSVPCCIPPAATDILQEILHVVAPHYVHMFESIFCSKRPWVFGHLYLPGGSKSLGAATHALASGSKAPLVGVLMQVGADGYNTLVGRQH